MILKSIVVYLLFYNIDCYQIILTVKHLINQIEKF